MAISFNPKTGALSTPTTGAVPFNPSAPAQTPAVTPASYEAQPAHQTAFGDQVNARADQVGKILNNATPAGNTNVLEKGAALFGQGVGVASDFTNDAIGGVTKPLLTTANNLTGGIGSALADKAVQAAIKTPLGAQGVHALSQGVDAWTSFEAKYPRAAQDLSAIGPLANLITTFATAGEAKAASEVVAPIVKDALKAGAQKTSTAIKDTVSDAGNAVKNKILGVKDKALERVTPDYNASSATVKQKLQAETIKDAPRINEGGIIKGRTVNATPLEKEAATELRTVPGYSDKLTNLQTENIVRPEIAARGKALTSSIEKENVLVPKKQVLSIVRNAVNEVPENSLLLQKSDPAISNYVRVAKNAAAVNDGTLGGVLKVRKALDTAYANARGKLAYDSDKLSALDEVHTAGRDALTKYLIDNAKNTKVKAALRSQWNLYRALDQIAPKAAREGGSKLQRAVDTAKAHPIVTGAALVGTGIGIGKTLGL